MDSIGLWLVKSQTIGTGVSSVTVTDAFSADYDNYKIIISGNARSSSQQPINIVLGASTTTYYGAYIFGNITAGTLGTAAMNNETSFLYAGGADINVVNLNVELQNPFLAEYTNIQALTVVYSNLRGSAIGEHETASSFTSFTLAPFAGTLTGGTIKVYGYRN
jgi:hypothetical protein